MLNRCFAIRIIMKRISYLLLITFILYFAFGCLPEQEPFPPNKHPDSHWKCEEVDIISHCNVKGDHSTMTGEVHIENNKYFVSIGSGQPGGMRNNIAMHLYADYENKTLKVSGGVWYGEYHWESDNVFVCKGQATGEFIGLLPDTLTFTRYYPDATGEG